MSLTATKLRQDLYRILDMVLATGRPVVIERKGKKLKIVPEKPVSKWNRLEKHDVISGDPEALIHLDWSKEWERHAGLP